MKIQTIFLGCFFLSFHIWSQSLTNPHLAEARNFHQQSLHKECITSAEKAIEFFQKNGDTTSYQFGEAHFFLGVALDHEEETRAVQILEKADEVFKNYIQTPDTLFCYLYFALGTSLSGQPLGKDLESISRFKKALQLLPNDSTVAWKLFKSKILSNMGGAFNQSYQMDKGAPLIKEALAIRQQYLPADHELIAKSFNQLGNLYFRQGQWETAINYYNNGLAIFKKIKPPGDFYIGALHHNMASLFRYQGKMQEAKDFYAIARAIFLEKLGTDHPITLSNLGILAYCHYQLGNDEEAVRLDELLLKKFIDKHGAIHEEVAGHLFDMASSLSDWSADRSKMLSLYEKALETAKKVPMTDRIASGYISCAVELADKTLGEKLVNTALIHLETTNPMITATLVADYYTAATFYTQIKAYRKALLYLDKINQYIGNDVWEKGNFEAMPNPIYSLYSFIQQGIVYQGLFEEKHQAIYLDSAALALNKALALYEFWTQQYSEETSQLFLQRDGKTLFQALFKNQILKNQLADQSPDWDNLFALAERSRATVLLQAVFEADASAFSGVPKEIVDQEQILKDQLLFNEQEYFAETNLGAAADSNYLAEVASKLIQLRQEKKDLTDLLRNQYPDFYSLRNLPAVAKLETVQQNISSDQALLEYFVSDSAVYVLVVQNNAVNFYTLLLNFDLAKQIEALRSEIRFWKHHSSRGNYPEIAFFLYQTLFEPLGELPQNLIIVPDDVLSYLPFELLIKIPANPHPDFRSLDYLINHHTISYNTAATLWLTLKEKEKSNRGWIGFAPNYEKEKEVENNVFALRNSLGPLLFNQSEVENIGAITNGDARVGAAASKVSFLEKAPQFGSLHIASHAKMNDQNPNFSFLAFSQNESFSDSGRLYVNEIYNQKIPAEMVILSACETGIGKFRRGEGLLSLSRAFLYAGAKSLITSLWSVNDKASADIMTHFYEQLAKGKPKDEALQISKQYYLSNCLNSESAHPFYWAGFVATGNMQSIDFQANRRYDYFFAALLLLGILIFFQKKWKKR